jgi:hypothetical protein
VSNDDGASDEKGAIDALTDRIQSLIGDVVHDLSNRGEPFTAADAFDEAVRRMRPLSATEARLVRAMRADLLTRPDALTTSVRRGSGYNQPSRTPHRGDA